MNNKIVDCITFFDNDFMFDIRYKILVNVVDFFVVCESKFDHRNNPKEINFKILNEYNKNKVKHIILDEPFPKKNNIWQNQAYQREYLLQSLNFLGSEDYIFFSDPDEIPNPEKLKNFKLNKKYGIFLQSWVINLLIN